MSEQLKRLLDKVKKLSKEKAKEWIGFDEWIEKLKDNQELNFEIENNLYQSQNMTNYNGIDTSKYIRVLEENIKLKNELDNIKNSREKIKITKSEYEVYNKILQHSLGIFGQHVAGNDVIFAKLRSKGIVEMSKNDIGFFEVVIFEKNFEVVED